MENLRAVRALAERYGKRLIMDGSRVIENAWYIQRHEAGMASRSIATLVKEIAKTAHVFQIDGAQDPKCPTGGLLVTDNPQTPLAELCGDWSQRILTEVKTQPALSPLYYQFWRDYDSLSVAAGYLEQADRTANEIMACCPEVDLSFDLARNRSTWGLYPAALTWVQNLAVPDWPLSLRNWHGRQKTSEPSGTSGILSRLVQAWILGQDRDR